MKSIAVAILFVSALCGAHAGAAHGTSRKLLQNAASPVPLQAVNAVPMLQRILADPYGAGPIVYKAAEAALWTWWANMPRTPSRPITDPALDVTLTDNSNLLMAWVNASGTLVMAFQGPQFPSNFNGTHPGFAPGSDLPWLQGSFPGAYAAAALSDPFVALVTGNTVNNTLAQLSGNQTPRRVLCTGYRAGGAYAELCGIWAAVTFPLASVRAITFGAYQVGNPVFGQAFEYLVDLSYLWTTTTDLKLTNATNPAYTNPGTVYLLNDTITRNNKAIWPNSLGQYITAVEETFNATSEPTTYEQGSSNQGSTGLLGKVGSFLSGITGTINSVSDLTTLASGIVDTAKAYAFRGPEASALDAQGDQIAAAARAMATGCPPILCKARSAATASCNVYANGTGTIAPGSITIQSNKTGAALAVAWDNPTKTAYIAFRGTSSNLDWKYDFMGFLTSSSQNNALQRTFPNVSVHQGFLEQFESVTDQAPSPSENITAVLDQLSGGQQPTRVVVTGHSLGAGVASVGGPWFALQYPAADVLVITFGSPMAGNYAFTQAFRAIVGRQLRFVHALDIVPALPPLDSYAAVQSGIWIPQNSTVVLEDRPPQDFDNLNWNDHNCRAGYEANLYSAKNALPAGTPITE